MELTALTLSEAADLIRQRKVSPVELTQACLDRIDALEPRLNSFITLTAESALQDAHDAEAALMSGDDLGPLHGIPIALKDLFDVARVPTTAGSHLMVNNVPQSDSFAAEKLRDAGAINLGKLNMQSWALGVTNYTSHVGPPRNPWDTSRITGGSSGGSGVALAAGLIFGSLGSDTGGSIRIPASLCSVVGLKPTYGRVSTRGVIPLSWSLDHAGPMARTVRDVALLLQTIAGYDPNDPYSANVPVDDYTADLDGGLHGLKIAFASGDYFERTSNDVADLVSYAGNLFGRLGARVGNVPFKMAEEAREVGRVILHSDAAAYHRDRLAANENDFAPELLPRLQDGLARTATEYALAKRKQAILRRRFEEFFEDYDLLLTPTTPITAVPLDDDSALETARILLGRFTAAFNLVGFPAISLPCGIDSHGLPVGLQIVARPWQEALLLRAAYAYEQATDWHTRKPEL